MKRILVISMPFKIGVGGFIRSYNVLPLLAKKLSEEFEVELYIPVNAIRAAIKFYTSSIQAGSKDITNINDILSSAVEKVLQDIEQLEKHSKHSFIINERVLRRSIDVNYEAFLRYTESSQLFPEYTRPVLAHIFVKRFCENVKKYYAVYEHMYSMHEAPDAITSMMCLADRSTKSAVLLQSGLGINPLEKIFNTWLYNQLTKEIDMKGLLAVSPAPLFESPHLLNIVNPSRIKILVPGNAIEKDLLEYCKTPKEPNTLVYYGRLSREKGLFDIVKAWAIVERKTSAKLLLIGRFEHESAKQKFVTLLKKYRIENIRYIGFISDRARLFNIVSKAGILLYPSYRDSFSLTVLESLALGLLVVAYDIPALRYLYGKSKSVKLVPLGNYRELALKVLESIEKHCVASDRYTENLIRLHMSWNAVAEEERRKLIALLSSNGF